MSILIKGMEMPNHCAMCKFHGRMDDPMIPQHWCEITGTAILNPYKERCSDCPLVETVRVTSARMVANEDALRIPVEAIKRELVYELAKEVESVTSWKVQDVPELHSKEVRMSLVIVPEERGVQSVRVD